jgi:glycosyltransferase involved in cell wall biosynthesis|tara:strand:- start:285 stop:1418 length:1134 start_codon:yes stop_codon:yes gene_type:complete
MKKNVLFISPTFYSLPLTDNIIKKHQYLDEVANVTVLAFSSHKKVFKESETNFYFSKKINSRIFNYFKILLLSYFQIPKLINKHNIDIVTFQDPITSFLGVYKIKKNFKNIKIVLESHGDFINTLELERNLLFPNVYKKLFLKMASYTIKNADILRAVSSSTEEQALSFDTSKRVVRFPAWIDFEIFSNIQPTRSDEGNFKILFIGSITDRKKPHLIIEALPKLHDDKVELHLVGPTPNHKYLDELREKIISNNLEDRVYIHGTKSRDEVKEFYSESNLMILPSVSEGLARVIFESQVTACPVLVTDAPGMQDIVIDGQTGYVFESNDLKTMIEKIDYIIKNYSEASAVGKNAKDFILSNYSADNFKFSFQKIFDTV